MSPIPLYLFLYHFKNFPGISGYFLLLCEKNMKITPMVEVKSFFIILRNRAVSEDFQEDTMACARSFMADLSHCVPLSSLLF